MTDGLATWLLEQVGQDEREIGQLDRGEGLAAFFFPDSPALHRYVKRSRAECDSKRRIVQSFTPCPECLHGLRCIPHDASACAHEDGVWRFYLPEEEHIARLMALPYSDRPGYLESWRP